MRRFQFELDSILRLRRFAEAHARQALAEAIAARNDAEQALDRTRAHMRYEIDRLRCDLMEMDASVVVQSWRELDRLELLELKQVRELADWEREVDAKQAAYRAAQRDRKSLDKLREQRQQEHDRQMDWLEQIENDERVVISHSRKGADP